MTQTASNTQGTPAGQPPGEPGAPVPISPAGPSGPATGAGGGGLEAGTYEIIRGRLLEAAKDLQQRLERLNAARKQVFGAIDLKLIGSERITTANNCVPRDIIPVGHRCIFGYNVFIGLRSQVALDDVFAVYRRQNGTFVGEGLDLLADPQFQTDFQNLYKFYRQTVFSQLVLIGPHLYMAFRVGKADADVKTFKWLVEGERLRYVGNRFDHEFVAPPQHAFEWKRATRDMHRYGAFPHVSIEDRVFVETVGGDLTIKIEDNTETGEGVYRESVENPDQTLDDAEIYYAVVGNVVLLKIRPYQEEAFRYIVYNQKIQRAVRIDSIAEACVLLPADQGFIFPRGCYLQTGVMKQFDTDMSDMVFQERIDAPNGEDFLYVFYNRARGTYVLLSYNLISQDLMTPIVCGGFSRFPDGTMVYFRPDSQPQKHHLLQVWQTPYGSADLACGVQSDSYLFKVGNADIVRCMGECAELLRLLQREESYVGLYLDIARKAADIRDSYFWLGREEAFLLAGPLGQVAQAASAAVDEYEKVVRTRAAAAREVDRVASAAKDLIDSIDYHHLQEIRQFVDLLSRLRGLRGEAISCKDLRYADLERIAAVEAAIAQHIDTLSGRCVEFLLQESSLEPYAAEVAQQEQAAALLAKVADAREAQQRAGRTAAGLELLVDTVSSLPIADATQATAIVDRISLVYSHLNRVRSAVKNRLAELAIVEGRSEFNAQLKLLDQSAFNYLDVCDTPDKCDEYLAKVMLQVETIESRFAELDEFIPVLAEKREQLLEAFESRKAQLLADRNRRAAALLTAAERILKGVRNRAAGLETLAEINGLFAGDVMVQRLRETIRQLRDLGDSVKAEDVQGRLKALHQDTVRQFKDRQALYEDGQNIIRLGSHRFSVNRQELTLTMVQREGEMFYHLTGTGFMQPVGDQSFMALRDVWDMDSPAESPGVYRGEFLAWQMLREIDQAGNGLADTVRGQTGEQVLARVQQFLAGRHEEGYAKGVHDHDAARILKTLLDIRATVGLLRYPTRARALARVFWQLQGGQEPGASLQKRMAAIGQLRLLFPHEATQEEYVRELIGLLARFVGQSMLFEQGLVDQAAEYLFHELAQGPAFAAGREAAALKDAFLAHLRTSSFLPAFESALAGVESDPLGRYQLLRDWVRAFVRHESAGRSGQDPDDDRLELCDEAAALLLAPQGQAIGVIDADVRRSLTGMAGSHPRLAGGSYVLHYCRFVDALRDHEQRVLPRFRQFRQARQEMLDRYAADLRLSEFRANVLTTFVRNRLIDQVYLPLIGENLAKQIGAAGEAKRTDRQGLLLLISPPGYGKTTLMEYIANRLGLTFVKLNGPSLGHRVTSLDPAEAPNAAAREEIAKANLALEMGDNVMLYLDDIQHCNPELLQKFISLCDAQRRIEGVFGGRSRTYDLRGKRVCVVMAGNPYTESGQKFKIPDMLANRADTYNIGDIVGDNAAAFELSYIENCLTSNPVLAPLAQRSQNDVYAVIQLAQGTQRDALEFEGMYSAEELNEYVATVKKLFAVRNIVLKVNQQYILSAAQAEEFRTEPRFLLQGSYRNMNRIASRVLPVMNEQELWTLVLSSYEQDAQTLAGGAEANLLKFRELTGRLDEAQARRWEDIQRTFQRNQFMAGADGQDKISQAIRQLGSFAGGLDAIRQAIAQGVSALAAPKKDAPASPPPPAALSPAVVDLVGAQVQSLGGALGSIRSVLADAVTALGRQQVRREKRAAKDQAAAGEEVRQAAAAVLDKMNEIVLALRQQAALHAHEHQDNLTAVLEEQFKTLELWLQPVINHEVNRHAYAEQIMARFQAMADGYTRLIGAMRERYKTAPREGGGPAEAPPPARKHAGSVEAEQGADLRGKPHAPTPKKKPK